MTILQANVASAVNDKRLSLQDKELINQYAQYTASCHCPGCASICETETVSEVPISDIMRYLMFARCYGELKNVKSRFKDSPLKVRSQMGLIDYTQAEVKCPQRMDIGRLMQEATLELC